MFELVLAIKELSHYVKTFDATVQGASVVVQDRGLNGMNHLRVHIIPRRSGDTLNSA